MHPARSARCDALGLAMLPTLLPVLATLVAAARRAATETRTTSIATNPDQPRGAALPTYLSQVRAGRWLASITLSGEVYQAFFDTEEDAAGAILLAGYTLPETATA
jgi:hypothetical protein